MREVSCRIFQLLPIVEKKYKIPKALVISGTALDWNDLSNPQNRIDWCDYVQIASTLRHFFGNDTEFSAFIGDLAFKDTRKYNRLTGLFVSLSSIYINLIPIILKNYYSIPIYTAKKVPSGGIDVSIEIPARYQPSREFMIGASAVLSQTPTIIGLPPARVEKEVTDRRGEYKIYPPPEKTLWRRLSVLPSTIAASLSFLRILQDQNTELATSYNQLEQQTTNLRNVLAASSDGIAVVRDGRIIHANPALAHLLRYTSVQELIGQNTDRWVDASNLAELRAWAATHPAENERREIALQPVVGESLTVEYSAPRAITWENQPATLWLLRDITERRALGNALATASQREQASLARDLHDGLGQHLTGLAFKLKALESRLRHAGSPEADTATEMVALANQATTQARDLAHGLAPVDIDPQGLAPALRHLALNVSQLFHLRCTFVSDGPSITLPRGIANQLYRATQEAITNAHRHGRAKIISILLRQAVGELTLLIDDDGTGLPTDFIATQSPGMGLKIMRYRLTSIEGTFKIESSPTLGGARVRLNAPIKAEPAVTNLRAASTADTKTIPSRPVGATFRIVLVDDHAVVRAGLGQLLEQTHDFAVCGEASNPAEAEAACRDLAPDLLLTDLRLGEENALDYVRRLRASRPALRIVILSMFGKEHYAEAAIAAGADAYVMKQAAPDELLATLRQVCANKSPAR